MFRAVNIDVDMENQVFKVVMFFSDVEELMHALNAYSIKNRVKVTKMRNKYKRPEVSCMTGCP